MSAIQTRVGTTATVLNEIRSIKMTGLRQQVTENIQGLRVRETDLMREFRWDVVFQNVASNIPGAAVPSLTFGLYAIFAALQGNLSSIDTNQAFTSLSIMSLVSNPAARLLSNITFAAAGMGSIERIQKFLRSPEQQDGRQYVADTQGTMESREPPLRSAAGTTKWCSNLRSRLGCVPNVV